MIVIREIYMTQTHCRNHIKISLVPQFDEGVPTARGEMCLVLWNELSDKERDSLVWMAKEHQESARAGIRS